MVRYAVSNEISVLSMCLLFDTFLMVFLRSLLVSKAVHLALVVRVIDEAILSLASLATLMSHSSYQS